MLTKRSVATVVVYTVLTCGIYGVWWTYVTCQALQAEGKRTEIPPVLTMLMTLFFASLGGVLLGLDADENIKAIRADKGMPVADNKVAWMVIGFFIPIALLALVQYEINTVIDAVQP